MKSNFNPINKTWSRKFPDSLSQHDVIYKSPPDDPLRGLPVGNGDMGMLLWTEDSRLVAAINKVDLFDDFPDKGQGMQLGATYDHESTLRHGAKLIIDFKMPVFDVIYLKDFDGNMKISDATVNLESKTHFSNIKIKSYASNSDKVIVLKCQAKYDEPMSLNTTLERYGSRAYSFWYSNFSKDASIGLEGTQTSIEGDTLLIHQQLRSLDFVVGARMVDMKGNIKRQNSHGGYFESDTNNTVEFTLLITVLTSENVVDPKAGVIEILDNAITKGEEEIYKEHKDDWEKFWKASFLSIPNKYIENIWYLNLYFANSSSRGEYLPRFVNGVWGWNRDVANWSNYFHWNTQDIMWALHTANHAELSMPQFKFRTKSLENAKIFAKNQQKKDGAFYADVVDRLGRSRDTHWYNNTPGSQIALQYWKHFKYTGDMTFMEEHAWPVIHEVTKYYASLVVKGEDGKYRTQLSQAYEGSSLMDEVITDSAMIKALMPVSIECAKIVGYEDDEIKNWKNIYENMIDFHLQELEECEYSKNEDGKYVLNYGVGKGEEISDNKIFTVGIHNRIAGQEKEDFSWDNLPDYLRVQFKPMKKGDRIRCRSYKPNNAYYGIPDPEFVVVFPGDLISLKDKGTELFNASVNQALLHSSFEPPEHAGNYDMVKGSELCCGWCPFPIVLARLGLSDKAETALENYAKSWQIYSQGFSHWGIYETCHEDKNIRWKTNTVSVDNTNEKLLSPSWPFRYFTFESSPILSAGLNEMLLQSHEGFIRMLPATPDNWEGSFMLATEKGFIVHTQYTSGTPDWFAVESKRGEGCIIVNPWAKSNVYITTIDNEGNKIDTIQAEIKTQGPDEMIAFDTKTDYLYLLSTESNILDNWEVEEEVFETNKESKTLGQAQLGLPRTF